MENNNVSLDQLRGVKSEAIPNPNLRKGKVPKTNRPTGKVKPVDPSELLGLKSKAQMDRENPEYAPREEKIFGDIDKAIERKMEEVQKAQDIYDQNEGDITKEDLNDIIGFDPDEMLKNPPRPGKHYTRVPGTKPNNGAEKADNAQPVNVEPVRERGKVTIGDLGEPGSVSTHPSYVNEKPEDKTEEEIMAGFHQKWRYNIRLASRKGVTVKDGTKEDLKDFHKIMIETGARDGFIIRPLEYFEKMYECLGPEHMKVLMAYYDGKPISGVIPIFYGNKTWYLYGASSNEHRNLMPNYLLQWEMIKMAIARHDDVYDFRGVSGVVDENHPQYGLYRFKKGFGATFTEFIGEVYMPYKPLTYKLYKFSEKAFRTVRQIKRKLIK